MNPASQALSEFVNTTFYVSSATMLLIVVGLIVFTVWALSDVPDQVHRVTDAESPVVKGYGCLNLITAAIVIFVVMVAISALLGGGK